MLQELRGLRHSDQTRGDCASALALYIIYVNLRKVHTQAHRRGAEPRNDCAEAKEKGGAMT